MSPIQSGSSSQLLIIGERKRSGLILCKEHYAEFAGPGAAICDRFELSYAKVITIGSPEIVCVDTYEERQQAYRRRIQWVRWLQRIVAHPEASQRAEKLFSGFEEFFGSEILSCISDEVLALLVGVLPYTIAHLRSLQSLAEYRESHTYSYTNDCLHVEEISFNKPPQSLNKISVTPASNNICIKSFSSLPCTA